MLSGHEPIMIENIEITDPLLERYFVFSLSSLAALAVFGLGSGLLDVGPAAMLGDILGGQCGTVVAAYQMAGDIGSVTGPVSAGYLVDVASYGAAFGLAAGVLGLAAVLGLFAPETRWRGRPDASPPRPGGATGRTSRSGRQAPCPDP